jgi:cytochrome c-type biogenesis protein CcmH
MPHRLDVPRAHGERMRGFTLSLVLVGLLVAVGRGHAQDVDPSLRALEERFIAPCCWTEPLSTHDSPLAHELREELRVRLTAGESPASIEASMVERYGERVLSTPPGIEPIAAGMLAAILLVGLVLYARRRRSTGDLPPPAEHAPPTDPALDDALRRELAALDD